MDKEKMLNLYNYIKVNNDLTSLLEEKFYLSDTYYQYEYEYEFRNVDDPYGAFIAAGYDLISKYPLEYEEIKKFINEEMKFDGVLSDDEIMIMTTTLLAKYFKNRVDQYNGLVQGDEWASTPEMVEYYGSKNVANNRGYDSYIDHHLGGDYSLLNRIVDEYTNKEKLK